MGDVHLTFDDGSTVRLHLAPTTGATRAPADGSQHGSRTGEPSDLELPEDFGSAQPVSVGSRAARTLARGGDVLTQALNPLGGVLSSIHQSFSQFAARPDEVTVEFGATLGSDLSLGVFSGKGEASFTVSATWNLSERPTAAPPSSGGSATGASSSVTS
ncbi:CU044_2847 family protein [Streptomyces javensis]|uniref:CU044_2847 family protein n=1 Tax=Streptomyces javensis TaxID=114698 RepID=UPI0031E08BE7